MSYPLHRLMSVLSLTMSIIMAANVSASSIINGTRFIYPSDEREITVQVDNKNSYPVLLQSWIDDGHSQIEPEKMNVPFILTPPLTRVEAGKGQTLRINYIGADLSPDREHVFWLNVLEIPQNEKDTKNHLQVAFRS
ncbi:molecular chaperone, partial [Klebsiella pneumoniae]|uniref:fimbrial biogenesis chaperone n=1 Tax=Klebsiella pneumoniae TaxID=573 RepID=UPI003B5A69B9